MTFGLETLFILENKFDFHGITPERTRFVKGTQTLGAETLGGQKVTTML